MVTRGLHSSKVISPLKNFPANTEVCALLNDEGTSWIEDRVLDEFLPHEAQNILSIPLSSCRSIDTRIWRKTKNGVYFTKSAYRILAESDSAAKPGPSNSALNNAFRTEIWRLNIPNKIKHFLRRACSDSLPTKGNLFRRKITTNATCDCCRDQAEDTIHALWDCYVVTEIWWEEEFCRPQLPKRFVNF